MIVLYPFNLWMARKRYMNWIMYALGGPDIGDSVNKSPGFKNAWAAVLVCVGLFAAMLGWLASLPS